jgi:hypothetical protein
MEMIRFDGTRVFAGRQTGFANAISAAGTFRSQNIPINVDDFPSG